jgi:hypothetical protein
LKELPKLPDEYNLKEYDPILFEIETEWHKFVGEQFAKVNKLFLRFVFLVFRF